MKNIFDDLLKSGDSDKIAENPWGSGQGIDIDTPSGDADEIAENPWSKVKSDF